MRTRTTAATSCDVRAVIARHPVRPPGTLPRIPRPRCVRGAKPGPVRRPRSLRSSRSHLDRIDVGEMPRDAAEAPPLVAARPHFARRRAEVNAGWLASVGGHRLALHRPPRLRLRHSLILALPCLAGVAR